MFSSFFYLPKIPNSVKLWSSDVSVTHFTAGLFLVFPQFFVTTIYIFIFQLLNLPTCGAFWGAWAWNISHSTESKKFLHQRVKTSRYVFYLNYLYDHLKLTPVFYWSFFLNNYSLAMNSCLSRRSTLSCEPSINNNYQLKGRHW